MKNNMEIYTPEYISGIMSLRKPQKASLEILENILNYVAPSKTMDLEEALKVVNHLYPICTDFEREFMSLSFVLATGVGKTRLMGAFISYLFAMHGIKNFFVVAPGNTVYNKLKKDLGDPSNPKYVFKGVGCFDTPPKVIADDDYRHQNLSLFESDINIYVFNISKFDKENVNMKAINEFLGESFFSKVSTLEDLVIIMDESHHYHGAKGAMALNELKPILGLELTATPYYNKGSKQVQFKNAVYEYPLSASIHDGYTRTPFAVTRQDINFYNFGEDELDKTMLADGIFCHEKIKQDLGVYAKENNVRAVKPFVMVVCKDTEHATKVYDYIISDAFEDGRYRNKTLLIHSNQSKAKREENVEMLLGVEMSENPIEIVIHVDMLKEGWDVNNLYTIIPLRTAASRILREQMVGRGLRLPYEKRTGNKEIDSVLLTAHDKFEELLLEAQSGESIFKAGNVIKVEEIVKQNIIESQVALDIPDNGIDEVYDITGIEKSEETTRFIYDTQNLIKTKVSNEFSYSQNRKNIPNHTMITNDIIKEIEQKEDLSKIFKDNEMPLLSWITEETYKYTVETMNKFIPIPLIMVTQEGIEQYQFIDFDLELVDFRHTPIENDILIQNLENMQDKDHIKGRYIDFDGYHPQKMLLLELRKKAEIDYESCPELIQKLVTQVIRHFTDKYGLNGMKNIVMMNKRDIANRIFRQMMREDHFYYANGFVREEVVGVSKQNLFTKYQYSTVKNFYEEPEGIISNNLFQGINKGVFSSAKFDSRPELIFARVIETDIDVLNWLRPNPNEFKIYYNRGKKYEPDFVVETMDCIYLVEVKGEDKLNHPDVLAKKERAISYCKIATEWSKANGYKEWKYLFIPAGQITSSSSFEYLAKRFNEVKNQSV